MPYVFFAVCRTGVITEVFNVNYFSCTVYSDMVAWRGEDSVEDIVYTNEFILYIISNTPNILKFIVNYILPYLLRHYICVMHECRVYLAFACASVHAH